MYKTLILLLFISATVYSQQNPDSSRIDSITLDYFKNEKWDELIKTGKTASDHEVDFKYLQQRMGYAYFMKGNYYSAIKHYEKSLKFDPKDEIAHLYLYFCGLNTGDESYSRYHGGKLTKEMQKELKIQTFRPVDAVDVEYNKKFNKNELRSNPDYLRLGLNSQIGYRLNLYQTVSLYTQTTDYTTDITQDEYFGVLSWTVLSKTNLSLGYHFVNTKVNTETESFLYPGHIWIGNISQTIKRLYIGVVGSVFSNDYVRTTQFGTQIGVSLPGKRHPNLKSSIYNINENGINRIVYSQKAGLFVFKKLWSEASVTFGNLNNFVDLNGLYFYNSLDQTTFRTGASLFWYINPHLIGYTNSTYDKKLIIQTLSNYNQYSLTGGIIWKL
ncbi:MAG: hypothetical protein H6Q19_227 [Bacteroidetes bacterium]|nr:hypothetical protein [Bacteroidota bacterium]